jgi:insulysin
MESIHDFPEDFGKKSEPWYGIEYYVTPVTDYAQWNAMGKTELLDPSQLHLPRPNRYIPRVLELAEELPPEAKQGPRIEKEIDPPNLLTWNRAGRLWHRLDDRYALPKSSLNFLIRNAAVEHSMIDGAWQFDPQASVHSTILGGIFLQAMAQDTYDADLAGLSWSLTCSTSGIRIQCGGYSDRLSDLALKVLQDFLDGDFIQESYYRATKDRILRNLQSYFSSRRADSHALHYQDLFFSSKQIEIDVSLSITENTTFHEIIAQHRRIVENAEIEIDCLYSGNVSETRAKDFFADASDLVNKARTEIEEEQVFIAGPEHRRLEYGRDVELHFASENEAEENGAVLMTYQSQVPGFRGPNLSSPESLMSSAAIRLVCHMLREPLFDVLRTKQQLGYIVSSYYDLEFAHTNDKVAPIDLITIVVLSRKVAPPEVVARIDEFLSDFKMSLINMPESEIRDHADALSTKLLKPIQKLVSETSTHFAKIRRYGPEILRSGGTGVDLPWDSVKDLAGAIRGLQRQDLVSAWDRVVLGPHRSRITSMVYGSTFPLDENLARKRASMKTRVFINDSKGLVKVREKLSVFDNSVPRGSPLMRLLPTSTPARIGIAAAAIGVIGFTIYSTTNRRKR